jgi:hypothetical protein
VFPGLPGLEVVELGYQALRWPAARRLIVVQEDLNCHGRSITAVKVGAYT